MDREQSWNVIECERLRLAALLETLSQDEWNQPSLCAGWRVRDVAAHVALTPQPPSVLGMLAEGVRAGGRFHKLNHDVAVRHAARPGVDVVAELRDHAASRRLPAVTSYRNILFDVLVHSQDIALPLGRRHSMPIDAARAGAQRAWTMGWPFWARHRLRHYRLTATDITWSVGRGADVDGPIEALLLLITGRAASLLRLSGPGVPMLRRHFQTGTPSPGRPPRRPTNTPSKSCRPRPGQPARTRSTRRAAAVADPLIVDTSASIDLSDAVHPGSDQQSSGPSNPGSAVGGHTGLS